METIYKWCGNSSGIVNTLGLLLALGSRGQEERIAIQNWKEKVMERWPPKRNYDLESRDSVCPGKTH